MTGLEENYCRNPDGGDTIWCYTTSPDERWGYCDPIVNEPILKLEGKKCLNRGGELTASSL